MTLNKFYFVAIFQSKCEKYWPKAKETIEFTSMSITSVDERSCDGYVIRKFIVTNNNSHHEPVRAVLKCLMFSVVLICFY